jgi:hypothetical protein
MIRRWLGLLAGVLTVLTAGCTGIPMNSPPQVVQTLPADGATSEAELRPPAPGAQPQEIVAGFLAANVSSDAEHTVAKQYLTATAASQWQVNPVTVVDDYRIGLFVGGVIRVTANQQLGTVDSIGQYHPNSGSGSRAATFTFKVVQVDGQYRISEAPDGLLIKEAQFAVSYRQVRELYFFDSTLSYLIPDQRYTAVAGQSLSTWILDALIRGPGMTLAGIARSAFPQSLDARSARATLGANGTVTLSIPGSSQLAPTLLRALAAQLAYTYDAAGQTSLRLTDGSAVVTVPGAPTTFGASDFAAFDPRNYGQPQPGAYFLRDGALMVSHGPEPKKVSGPFGAGTYPLRSVALRSGSTGQVDVAGVRLDRNELLIGSLSGEPTAVALGPGTPTRPEWDRSSRQVWIGVGARLWVVLNGSKTAVAVNDNVDPLPTDFTIRSVRLSPEGARVALVIAGPGGSSQLWVGAVSTTATGSQITGLSTITPRGDVVADAGWSTPTQLYYTARQSGGTFTVSSIQEDGALQQTVQTPATAQLPDAPTSIAVAPGVEPIVAIGPLENSFLYELTAGGWTALGGGRAQVAGYAPALAG